jgi:hypothetical protein
MFIKEMDFASQRLKSIDDWLLVGEGGGTLVFRYTGFDENLVSYT